MSLLDHRRHLPAFTSGFWVIEAVQVTCHSFEGVNGLTLEMFCFLLASVLLGLGWLRKP